MQILPSRTLTVSKEISTDLAFNEVCTCVGNVSEVCCVRPSEVWTQLVITPLE